MISFESPWKELVLNARRPLTGSQHPESKRVNMCKANQEMINRAVPPGIMGGDCSMMRLTHHETQSSFT